MGDRTDFERFCLWAAIEVYSIAADDKMNSISDTFDMWIAILLTNKIKVNKNSAIITTNYLGIDKVEDGKFTNDQLLALAKAGSYIRYASEMSTILDFREMRFHEFEAEFYNMYDKKVEEDNPSEDAMEEIERLMEETDEIMEGIEDEEDTEDDESDDNEEDTEETEE